MERAAVPRPQDRLQVRGRPPLAEGDWLRPGGAISAVRTVRSLQDAADPASEESLRSRGDWSRAGRRRQRRSLPPCGPRRGLAAAGGPGWASRSSQRIQAGAFWLTPVSLSGAASVSRGQREWKGSVQALLRCFFSPSSRANFSGTRLGNRERRLLCEREVYFPRWVSARSFGSLDISLPGPFQLFGQVTSLSDHRVFLVGCLAISAGQGVP